jgi:hypothetical protein
MRCDLFEVGPDREAGDASGICERHLKTELAEERPVRWWVA